MLTFLRHHSSSTPSYPVKRRPKMRLFTGSSSHILAICLAHMWLWLQHNVHSTPLQRESLYLLPLSNVYIIYTPGPMPGGLNLHLASLGLTWNCSLTLTQIWGRICIYLPFEGTLPQFVLTSTGILRWDWSRGHTHIYLRI